MLRTCPDHQVLATGESPPDVGLGAKHPLEKQFPIKLSTNFPKELRAYSPASLRALFRLQAGTTPFDPYPGNPPK